VKLLKVFKKMHWKVISLDVPLLSVALVKLLFYYFLCAFKLFRIVGSLCGFIPLRLNFGLQIIFDFFT
jgi:hypothetical protein